MGGGGVGGFGRQPLFWGEIYTFPIQCVNEWIRIIRNFV